MIALLAATAGFEREMRFGTLEITVVLAIVYVARGVLVIFTFSILFAYLIDTVVRFLQRHSLIFRNLRGPHVAEAYLCLLILIPLVIHLVAPGSLGKTTKLAKQIPAFAAGISSGEIATQIGGKYGWSEPQQQRLKLFLVEHQANIEGVARGWERSAFSALAGLVVIPILAIFFLSDGGIVNLLVVSHRRFVNFFLIHRGGLGHVLVVDRRFGNIFFVVDRRIGNVVVCGSVEFHVGKGAVHGLLDRSRRRRGNV